MRTLLEDQFDALVGWLDAVPVSAHLAVPVGLGDWTVRELVALLPGAVAAVTEALAAAYAERSGGIPTEASGLVWLRLATGRTPSEDPHLPLL